MANPNNPYRSPSEFGGSRLSGTGTSTTPGQSATEQAKETCGTVMEQAKDVAGQVGQRAQDALSAVSHKASDVASSLRHQAEDAASAVSETWESGRRYIAQEGFSGMAEDVANIIRRNPIPALLIGFGLGFMVARAMNRD